MEELDKKESSSDEFSDNNGGNIEISWDINFENEKNFGNNFVYKIWHMFLLYVHYVNKIHLELMKEKTEKI